MTRISVCIATVRAATIRTAVAAILRQTWHDWELIVVGQGRRDERETAVAGRISRRSSGSGGSA